MRALKLLMRLPFNSWSKEEQESLPDMVEKLLDAGSAVVLGDKRCFLCGVGLDGRVIGARVEGESPEIRLVVNLCNRCTLQQGTIRRSN